MERERYRERQGMSEKESRGKTKRQVERER